MYYSGYYIPGPNDHGDTAVSILVRDAEELASLLQATVDTLCWIDFGGKQPCRMFMREDMQQDDGAPVNGAATKILLMTTQLEKVAIRGPAATFLRNESPPVMPRGNVS